MEKPGNILLHPEGLYDQLEFTKILEDLSGRCLGEPAKNALMDAKPLNDAMAIQVKWAEISEMKEALSAGEKIASAPYQTLTRIFSWLEIQNSVLSVEDTLELKNQILLVNDWLSFFQKNSVCSVNVGCSNWFWYIWFSNSLLSFATRTLREVESCLILQKTYSIISAIARLQCFS